MIDKHSPDVEPSQADPVADATTPGPKKKPASLKPAQVRSVSIALQKEARKALKKYPERIGNPGTDEIRASVAAIDTHLRAESWSELSDEAENLDELLQKHAGFARKSALRETRDNVLFAVAVALLLRSCTFEPFNIPSQSMMPTLRVGDYIFVNKFTHGIQVPFTTTIVGEEWGRDIVRGEVIVFRFPLDNSIDYIKRVIGLPGDVLRFQGERMWIQRNGEGEFDEILRTKLDIPCYSDDSHQPIRNCDVYEEKLDGNRYRVRYVRGHGTFTSAPVRTVRIPKDSYLVRGDNREQSHDSLRWEDIADIAKAESVLTDRDLRDVFSNPELQATRKINEDLLVDPTHSQVQYTVPESDAKLKHRMQIWRQPLWGSSAQYSGIRRELEKKTTLRSTRIDALIEDAPQAAGAQDSRVARAVAVGRQLDALLVGETSDSFEALLHLEPANLVLHYHCGKSICTNRFELALALAQYVERVQSSPESDASRVLADPQLGDGVVFEHRRSSARTQTIGRFWSGEYTVDAASTDAAEGQLRIDVFRNGTEGLDFLRESALSSVGSSGFQASSIADLEGKVAWVETPEQFAAFWELTPAESKQIALFVRCDRAICKDATGFRSLLSDMQEPVSAAAQGNLRLSAILKNRPELILRKDSEASDALYPWDAAESIGTRAGAKQSVNLEMYWGQNVDLRKRLELWRKTYANAADESRLGAGAFLVKDSDAFRVGFAQFRSDSVFMLECGVGLCTSEDLAMELANRVLEGASDPEKFVVRGAIVPKPFVPRGNIKGRADYIWWPFDRIRSGMDNLDDSESAAK